MTHGKSETDEYHTWESMIQRCTNPNAANFKYYGGKGISVCDRWLNSFELFLADMGMRPTKRHQIDRRETHLGYSPENCRWATPKENSRNKTTNKILVFAGKSATLAEWSEETGIPYSAINDRLDMGWSVDDALSRPLRRKISRDDVREIFTAYHIKGEAKKSLQQRFGLPKATIRYIVACRDRSEDTADLKKEFEQNGLLRPSSERKAAFSRRL